MIVYNRHIMFNPTLMLLINFVPNDDDENIMNNETVLLDYLEDTKSSWSKGKYYLGGFTILSPDDEITMMSIENARNMMNHNIQEYGYANGAEYGSVMRANRQLCEMETIVKKYIKVMKRRTLAILNKTALNTDVNSIIMSMF